MIEDIYNSVCLSISSCVRLSGLSKAVLPMYASLMSEWLPMELPKTKRCLTKFDLYLPVAQLPFNYLKTHLTK